MSYTVYVGDCLDGLHELPDGAARTCVTSPPYFGLRDYGHEGQIGHEQSPAEYIEKMVSVFREVKRALADDGTVWLNLGDSYGGSRSGPQGKSGEMATRTVSQHRLSRHRGTTQPGGAKQLLGIPWRVAFALQADGWYLRQDIIWHKPNPMPESVRDRCTKAHEYIFLLTKSPRYYFDVDAIKEDAKTNDPRRPYTSQGAKQLDGRTEWKSGERRDSNDFTKRNRRSVWTVSTRPFKGAHFATFPPDLIEPCVLAGSAQGDLVIDPFTGSGTTGMVAGAHGRKFYGCELNPEYAEMANERIAAAYAQGRLFQ